MEWFVTLIDGLEIEELYRSITRQKFVRPSQRVETCPIGGRLARKYSRER